jgi:hypothetical protein
VTIENFLAEIWIHVVQEVVTNSAADVLSVDRPLRGTECNDGAASWTPEGVTADVAALLHPLLESVPMSRRC